MATICIFGDSTAFGAWDKEHGGWAELLWLSFAQDENHFVYNLSIDGGTSETILTRFEQEASVRQADILIFQTGANDAAFPFGTTTPTIALEKFIETMRTVIARAKMITPHIIIMGNEHYDESKTVPVSWCNLCYTNALRVSYNDALRMIAQQEGVLFSEPAALTSDDLYDGLHPNTQGHKKIVDALQKTLYKLLS